MKKNLFAFILIFLFTHLSAQDFLDVVAQEVCECINSKNEQEMTRKQIENQLGTCMLISIGKNKSGFEDYTKGKTMNEEDMRSLGTEVGMKNGFCLSPIFLRFNRKRKCI